MICPASLVIFGRVLCTLCLIPKSLFFPIDSTPKFRIEIQIAKRFWWEIYANTVK